MDRTRVGYLDRRSRLLSVWLEHFLADRRRQQSRLDTAKPQLQVELIGKDYEKETSATLCHFVFCERDFSTLR